MLEELNSGFTFSPPAFALIFALIFAPFLFSCIKGRKNKLTSSETPFVVSIFHIERVRAKPKMLRIYAARIVTGVTDYSAFRDWAFELFKDNPMRKARSVAFIFPRDLPIAFVIQRALIVPTAGREIDFNLQEDSLPR